MGKMSRNKGNGFERQVAHLMIEALAPLQATRKEIFRTPLSGGHPFAHRGDLQIDPRLHPFCPFIVECKHTAKWNPGAMVSYPLRESEKAWFLQLKTAHKEAAEKTHGLVPLLIMSGNFTGIFVAAPHVEIIRLMPYLSSSRPQIRFRYEGELWTLWRWEDFSRVWSQEIQRRLEVIKAGEDLKAKGKRPAV